MQEISPTTGHDLHLVWDNDDHMYIRNLPSSLRPVGQPLRSSLCLSSARLQPLSHENPIATIRWSTLCCHYRLYIIHDTVILLFLLAPQGWVYREFTFLKTRQVAGLELVCLKPV